MDRGAYNARGPAADGSLGTTQHPSQGERQEQRQERREERQDRRAERREDWQEYAEDHDDYYDDGRYYGAAGTVAVGAVAEPFYDTLPCTPVVMAMGGVVYYVCGPDWYIRAYSDGDVVYTMVPPPTGQ